MSTTVKAADLAITIVVAVLKTAGLGPEADRLLDAIEGAKNCINLIEDIKNETISDPNKELIRSLFKAIKEELGSIKAHLKDQGLGKDEIESTADALTETTRLTVKQLAQDDDALLDAARLPDSFFKILVHRAEPLPDWCDDTIGKLYEQLLKRVSAEFIKRAKDFDRFDKVALASLLRDNLSATKQRNRIERGVQENRAINLETNQVVKEDRDTGLETNQLVKELVQRHPYSIPSRLIFGSRPDVVAEDRFIERREQEQLHSLIADPTRRRTVLIGMRGCGKTQLAASLAKQCEDANWNLVAWINAVSPESIKSDLVELAKEYNIETSDIPAPKDIVKRLFNRLKSKVHFDRLIVFDNVENIDDLRGLVPSGIGLRVVATTTNDTGWEHQGWKTIRVGVFDRSESINHLLTVTKSDDHDAADALAKSLGDLPLAIAQAAATARHKRLSLRRYLKQLESHKGHAIDPVRGDYYTVDVAMALWMALEGAIDDLEGTTKETARRQLDALALLAESGVPTRWLDPTITQLDDNESPDTQRDADEDAHDALTELIHRSIVQQSADGSTTMLHRLQAQVLRESWNKKESRQAIGSCTALINEVTTNMACGNNTDSRRHDTLDLIEQLRAVSAQKYSQCLLAESATQNCLFQAFEQAFELGVPQHAVNLSATVSFFNSIENVEPSDALALQNQLGCAYEAAGDYDTAIRLHSEVLAAYGQMIDIDAEEILISRNNLATAYKANRNIPKAIEIFEGTFKEAYQRYGLEHEQTIGSLNNLAETYTQVYEPDIILPMFIVAFELSKKILNPADDISLAIRNNLALTYLKMGDATKAISELISLLQDRQRFHLDRHVEHLITLRNLAEAHEANGDIEEAISTLKRARTEGTELHGDHHLETLWTDNSLGCAYLQDNQFESARHEFESALAKCDEFLDYNHPLTTTIRTNLEYVEQLLATTSESGPTTKRHMD